MLTKIKDKIARIAQRALGIDYMHFKLDVITNKLAQLEPKVDALSAELTNRLTQLKPKIDEFPNRLAQLEPKVDALSAQFELKVDSLFWQIRGGFEGLDRLKSFLTWSANRVEPWLPAESFAQSEPDYDMAGFLYNFLPNRVAVDVGAAHSEFAKALSGIGYQVFCFSATAETFEKLRKETVNLPRVQVLDIVMEGSETLAENAPTNTGPTHPSEHREGTRKGRPRLTTIASLVSSGILPAQIDLMKIDTDKTDLEVTKGLTSVRPAVIQIEFSSEDFFEQRKDQTPTVSVSEKIKAMRNLEYYWNIIIFRVDSEDFVRMAANLGATPKQSWGKIFFFQDYRLFLRAHQWCKDALPRFRAAALPSR
jgi:FkbM family methyltransferase